MKKNKLYSSLRLNAEWTIKPRIVNAITTVVYLTLLFQSQYTKIIADPSSAVEKIISYIPILMAFAIVVYSLFVRKKSSAVREGKEIVRMYFPYFILIVMSLVFAFCFNQYAISLYGVKYLSRFFIKLLLRVSFIIIVVCSWLINKKDCIRTLKNAVILDGFLIILLAIREHGLSQTMLACIAPLGLADENEATYILEVHEATFVIGLLLLYYLFNEKEKKRTIIILAILFVIGGKRIAFGALAAALAVVLPISKSKNKRFYAFYALTIAVGCFAQLCLLYSGTFFYIMKRMNINLNNRDLIYGFFLRRTDLNPLYFGWGFSAVSRVIENMKVSEVKWMVVIRGLHCDILKQYIEFGFLGFIYWLYFILIRLPSKLYRKLGEKSAKTYMLLMIFAIVTYMTDNTESYFLFQSTLLLLALAASKEKPLLYRLRDH
ncbi:MAG: hypothetical protein K2J32_13665 [Ruminococcus sp.]|nr:hypothetical protein [Ruminococcus sp.]